MRAGIKKPMVLQDAKPEGKGEAYRKKKWRSPVHNQRNDEPQQINRSCLPHLSGQSLQSNPPGLQYMFLSELPNQGLRYGPLHQKLTVGADHHTLLAPREHDVRPLLVTHESRGLGSDYRDDDVVPFISLKRVDVEYGIFPSEVCRFQRGLDRVPLGVVGGDDLEFLPFLDVTTSYLHDSSDFSFVLSGR